MQRQVKRLKKFVYNYITNLEREGMSGAMDKERIVKHIKSPHTFLLWAKRELEETTQLDFMDVCKAIDSAYRFSN